MKIPVWHPYLGNEENEGIAKTMENGYLGMGAAVFEFEGAVANEVGASEENIVATHTGQSALHVILECIKQIHGRLNNVLTPSMNNVADFQAILGAGAEPIFCDCDPKTGLIDINSIDEESAKIADAIIVLDYASNKTDLKSIRSFCDQNNLHLIYDAAHTFGSVKTDSMEIADATMFSFDPIKTFTAIDAGIIHSKNKELIKKARTIRHMGMEQDLNKLKNNGRSFGYDVPSIGYRYHLSNVHAVVGIEQIKKKKFISKERHSSLKKLRHLLKGEEIIKGWIPYDTEMIPFMNVCLIKREYRDTLRSFLDENGIQTGIHWKPGHLFTRFKNCRQTKDILEGTMDIYSEMLSLPLFPGITDEQINYIADKITEFANSASNN